MKYIIRVIFLNDFEKYLNKSRDRMNNLFLEKLDYLDTNQQFYYFKDTSIKQIQQIQEKIYIGNYLDCIQAIEEHKKYSEANNLRYEIWPETLLEYIYE